MDRNCYSTTQSRPVCVALRKESVDRNLPLTRNTTPNCESLSARRAWIEIPVYNDLQCIEYVALRKESVDRNTHCDGRFSRTRNVALRKESVDRNLASLKQWPSNGVALRKESVDRNIQYTPSMAGICSRSPQGERG